MQSAGFDNDAADDEDANAGKNYMNIHLGCPRGVMVKALDCGIVVREFVLQSRYYFDFRATWERYEPQVSSQLWVK